MVALSPSPNDTVSATTLANCSPSPISHSTVPASNDRENAGQDADQHHSQRAERQADEGRDENDLDRQRLGSACRSCVALLRAAIADRPVTAIL